MNLFLLVILTSSCLLGTTTGALDERYLLHIPNIPIYSNGLKLTVVTESEPDLLVFFHFPEDIVSTCLGPVP